MTGRSSVRAIQPVALRLLVRTVGPLLRLGSDGDRGFVARLDRSHADAVLAISPRSWERLIGSLGLVRYESVLDVGCGVGAWLPTLATLNRRVVAVDPDTSSLDAARAKTSGLDNVELLEMRAEALGFEPESFGAVACLSVLPYLDQAAALRQIERVLAPRGRLVIGTVGPGYYAKHVVEGIRHGRIDVAAYGLDPLLVTLARMIVANRVSAGLLQAWSPRAVRALLDSAGFTVERVFADVSPVDPSWPTRYAGSPVYFMVVASKRAQRSRAPRGDG